jgi:hypothetical protein
MNWFFEVLMLLIFVVPLIVLFCYAVYDVVRRHDIRVLHKSLWLIAFIVIPIIAPLVYLVIRPPGTTAQEAAMAGDEASRTKELMDLADLHDRGKLTDAEFEHVKAQHVDANYGRPATVKEQRGGQLM